tara:strand:- start:496 stop:1152 length:657 start_codon:yes stop_codon:yes gene_type:complete
MGRRIARGRIQTLTKIGVPLTKTSAKGIDFNVGEAVKISNGREIISEYVIDLAASGTPAYAFGTAGVPASKTGVRTIGQSSSAEPHKGAEVLVVNATGSAKDGNGIITSGELICVEAVLPVAASAIGVWYGSTTTGSDENFLLGTVGQLVVPQSQSVGQDGTFDVDTDLDNMFIYLVHSGAHGGVNGAAYTSGKFILRLYGFEKFNDIVSGSLTSTLT